MKRVEKIRLVQWGFGPSTWQSYPWASDYQIATGAITGGKLAKGITKLSDGKIVGPQLAGPGRDLRLLTDEEYAWLVVEKVAPNWKTDYYLKNPRFKNPEEWDAEPEIRLDIPANALSPEDQLRIKELLDKCPFIGYPPSFDIDVPDGAPVGSDVVALDFARKLDLWLPDNGFSRPTWCKTNARGGLHGDHRCSDEIASRKLLRAFQSVCREISKAIGIPLLSDYRKNDASRPPVVLDDTIFNHVPAGRAREWRLAGGVKKGYKKHPVDIWQDEAPESSSYTEPTPHPDATVNVWLDREEEPEPYAARGQRASLRATRTAVSIPVNQTAMPLPKLSSAIYEIQAAMPAGRGDFFFRVAAWLADSGLSRDVALATIPPASPDPTKETYRVNRTYDLWNQGADLITLRGPQLAKLSEILRVELDTRYQIKLQPPSSQQERYTSVKDRMLLKQAARKTNDARAARTMDDAAECGLYHDEIECEVEKGGCGHVHQDFVIMCERAGACPYCSAARTRAFAAYWSANWSEKIALLHIRTDSTDSKVTHDLAEAASRAAPRKGAWYIGPGHMLFLTGHTADVHYMSRFGTVIMAVRQKAAQLGVTITDSVEVKTSRGDAIARALAVHRAREAHLRKLLDSGDPDLIAKDTWINVRTHSHGRKSLIKNPSDPERRATLKDLAKKRREAAGETQRESEEREYCCPKMDDRATLTHKLTRGVGPDKEIVHKTALRFRPWRWSLPAAKREHLWARMRAGRDDG